MAKLEITLSQRPVVDIINPSTLALLSPDTNGCTDIFTGGCLLPRRQTNRLFQALKRGVPTSLLYKNEEGETLQYHVIAASKVHPESLNDNFSVNYLKKTRQTIVHCFLQILPE